MKKVMAILFSVVVLLTACEPEVKVNLDGDWKFSEMIEGSAELNNQNQNMVVAIKSIFNNAELSFKEGKVGLMSPSRGKMDGTYSISNGKLDMEFGGNNQISINVRNEGEKLVVLFGQDYIDETGKILFEKK